MFEHISEQGSPYEGVLKEASEDFDNLNQALRILSASIEDHINNLTQGKKPEEVLEFFEKYEEKIVVGSYHRFKTNDNLFYYRTSLYESLDKCEGALMDALVTDYMDAERVDKAEARMTRLHLINWHNFQDDIIDFKNITYLLGVNAVGKTTIMDAIRYCLTTNKDFNTAGNKKSGRTLLGSVHQKQRAEDSYLRPGHTVSYIGIEFLDENINKNFVITVRVESETPKQDLKGVYQDWYITKPGYSLEDIPFFTQVKGGRKPTSRDAFKLENKGMDRASNQADARRRICRMDDLILEMELVLR